VTVTGTELPAGPSRARRFVVGAALIATVVLVLVAAVIWVRTGFRVTGGYMWVVVPVTLLAALTYTGAGSVIVLRRNETRIGWLLVAMGLSVALTYVGFALASAPGSPLAVSDDVAAVAGLLSAGIVSPVGAALAVAFGLIFPTDRLLGPRWRWGIVLGVVGAVLSVVGNFVRPGPILFLPAIDNPLVPQAGATPAALLLPVGILLLASGALMAAASLLVRYRSAVGDTRRQIRLVVAAGIGLAALYVAFLAFSVADISGVARDAISVLMAIALLLSPVAVLVAIARYRLYDIDRLVGRGFVYGGLLALLAGLYAASMRLFTALFGGLLGESSEIALVVTTLLLATTLTPIKSRLERVATRWSHESGGEGGSAVPAASGAAEVTAAGTGADASGTAAPGNATIDPATREALRQLVREVLAEDGPGRPSSHAS
jgi:cytochrome bd-type quinol oxidase subunit 2